MDRAAATYTHRERERERERERMMVKPRELDVRVKLYSCRVDQERALLTSRRR